jgi:FtsP/CotA-like multicopper oxidase with cupredoxin domain
MTRHHIRRIWPVARALAAYALATAVLALPSLAHAQGRVPCEPTGVNLQKMDEIDSVGGVLRGTIVLTDAQQRLTFREPPGNEPGQTGSTITCSPQYLRFFQKGGAPASEGLGNPMPGPTLRARVGDIIELTFLNQVNPSNFPNSIDRAEKGQGDGCDASTAIQDAKLPAGYPAWARDTFPNCFHGSSTGNLHFHGTHTNPNGTADDVFLQIRPSPRVNGEPTVTKESVQPEFDQFFKDCEAKLRTSPLVEWPKTWADMPKTWIATQEALLKAYDANLLKYYPNAKSLWLADEQQIKDGIWPEYYIGAFPYCFQLPKYTDATYPPPPNALQMGQAPGTQWYHAHKHGSTTINLNNGMSGVFIIEGEYDDKINEFYDKYRAALGMNTEVPWTRQEPIMLVNQLGVTPNMERSKGPARTDKGPDFSVNGRLQPMVTMRPGEVQMWRIVNSSPRSAIWLPALPAGFNWKQLAQDGVQLIDENYQKSNNPSLFIAAGNRVDLLVQAPMTAQKKANVVVQPPVSKSEVVLPTGSKPLSQVTLMSIKVSGTPVRMPFMSKAPPFPKFLADIDDSEVKGPVRDLTFDSKAPAEPKQHTVNGEQFMEGMNWKVDPLNTVQEWKVMNTTSFAAIDHPFHIHINPFQVVEVFDPNQTILRAPSLRPGPEENTLIYKYVFDRSVPLQPGQCYLDPTKPDSWKPCNEVKQHNLIWWDVFPIPTARNVTVGSNNYVVYGYFLMRSRFVDFPGNYVMHCHILAHEDRGMMMVVSLAASDMGIMHH